MERERENFDHIKPAKPPVYLFGRIAGRIRAEQKLLATKKRAAYFSFVLTGSIAAFFAALLWLSGALVESEFLKFFSVVFSDPGIAAANWQDFSLYFLELLPVAYIVVFLAALLVFLESLKRAAKILGDISHWSKFVKQI